MTGIKHYEVGKSDAIEYEKPKPTPRVKKRNAAGVFEDYIPSREGPRFPPKRDREAAAQAAVEATRRRQEANRVSGQAVMTAKLAKMNAATAVEFIERQPAFIREQYLVAEEEGQNRKAVLSRFPKAGKLARGISGSSQLDLDLTEWKDEARKLRDHSPTQVPEGVEGAVILEPTPAVPGLPASISDEEFAALTEGTTPQPEETP